MLVTVLFFACVPKVGETGIYGVVSAKATGEPINAANVELGIYNDKYEVITRTTTGYDGRYEFQDIDAGSYRVIVSKNGYDDASYDLKVQSGENKHDFFMAGFAKVYGVVTYDNKFGSSLLVWTLKDNGINEDILIASVNSSPKDGYYEVSIPAGKYKFRTLGGSQVVTVLSDEVKELNFYY